METDTEEENGVSVQAAPAGSLPRFVRRCWCKAQSEKALGYDLCEWVGGRKSWKNHGGATYPEDIVKYASDKRLKTILVRCNGCGADVLREYPANDLNSATATRPAARDDTKAQPRSGSLE